ncbi:steroidogenic acute regulatory protein, mitochondrial [Amia ocellicauda]|uniref:steroidogenic acute regulatory protein, mitochondrial n=1 Tax=Amia ocellicauda TaxID=2972642 RepID=UPI00346484BB
MLPAVVKLCCGISYQHFRNMTGLQRMAMAAIGQEVNVMKLCGHITLPSIRFPAKPRKEEPVSSPAIFTDEELVFVRQGKEALQRALEILEEKEGWKIEISGGNGDVIFSKIVPGTGKVFRLEGVLDATPEELYNHLFVKVEEMNQWNPDVKQVKVLKHVGLDTKITHEVSAEKAGNLIGQRDFLSIRHCCKQKSSIYLAGVAANLESFPPQKGFVRAQDGPTCIIIQPLGNDKSRSQFTWLLNMDLKGWIPKSIVNQALPQVQVDFTKHLRKRLTSRLFSVPH